MTARRSNYFDAYFALKEGLQQVLGRPVDVVVAASVRNPYFPRQLRSEAEPLYAA